MSKGNFAYAEGELRPSRSAASALPKNPAISDFSILAMSD
jgi:hypothetical protein